MERRLILLALGCLFLMAAARILMGEVEFISLPPPGQNEFAFAVQVEPTALALFSLRLFLMAAFAFLVTLAILTVLWAKLAYTRNRRK
ncbi:MAG: hypothetical protein AAGH70_07535 [Pseudomonadota bacterium]